MRFAFSLLLLLFSAVTAALSLKPDAPKRYVVQPNDSLWSISARYLDKPWEWKELWPKDRKIKNPKYLYPGAILVLATHRKKPCINVLSNGRVTLSPNTRPLPLNEVIPAIPLGDIKPFLNESLILDKDVLKGAPYVLAYVGERMLGSQGDQLYVKGLPSSTSLPAGAKPTYSLFRGGENYRDPKTKAFLGYRANLVGYADLLKGGDPAIILLTSINEGIKIQDKILINQEPEFNFYFEPQAPQVSLSGVIIDIPNRMLVSNTQGVVGDVAVINLGAIHGVQAGDVLGIYKEPPKFADPQNKRAFVELPPERIGELMVFRVFTKTSFALIMRSTQAVYLLEAVKNP